MKDSLAMLLYPYLDISKWLLYILVLSRQVKFIMYIHILHTGLTIARTAASRKRSQSCTGSGFEHVFRAVLELTQHGF